MKHVFSIIRSLFFAALFISLQVWYLPQFAARASVTRIVGYGLALVTITECFVLFYEEPMLRRKFGGEYQEYCRRVSRWVPGIRHQR